MAVLNESNFVETFDNKDLKWEFYKGTGPGGQHKNKTLSAVRLTHIPTGTVVTYDGRSQFRNKENALCILKERVLECKRIIINNANNQSRQNQIGSGMRGDKIRTISVRDDTVIDHRLNKTMRYKDYIRRITF